MYVTDIVIKSSDGCEINRETIPDGYDLHEYLIVMLTRELLVLYPGDTITFENRWTEEIC